MGCEYGVCIDVVQLSAEFGGLGFGYLSVQKISCGEVSWTERCVCELDWTLRV